MNTKTDFSKLPKHWKIKKLKELVVSQKGKAPIHWFNRKTNEALPYLDVETLSTNNFTLFVDWYSTVWVTEKDICVLWDGGRNGLILKGKKGALGSTFYSLTPLAVDSDYLFYYLKTKEELRKDTRHVENSFWEMEIPIPPLEEQKHIAQSIQETYQEFETQNREAEKNLLGYFKRLLPIQSENLENILSLEGFKKAVLDLAVSGSLTNIIITKKVKLLEVCKSINSGSTPKKFSVNPKDIPFLKVYNLVNDKIDFFYKPQYVERNIHNSNLKKSITYPNDVLLNIVGPPLGKTAIVPDLFPEWNINQAIAVFKVDENKLISNYLYYLFLQGNLVNGILPTAKGNAGQSNISINQCRSFEILLPLIKEQTEIVHIVETIFAEADKIQQDFELQKKQQNDLLKSVINAFFQYSNLPVTQTDWDLDTQIKEAREKKEKEIKLLKDKQMAKRKDEASKPKPDILSLLKETGTSMSANDLLEESKFHNNVDDFYSEAKDLDSKGVFKWEIGKETQNTEKPLSMLTLIEEKQ